MTHDRWFFDRYLVFGDDGRVYEAPEPVWDEGRSSVPAEVRPVGPQDWRDMRALRLEALVDTPIGFLETFEQAQQIPDHVWQERAANNGVADDIFQVMAWDGGRPVGNSVSFLREGRAWLVAVYITPAARGGGLVDQLVTACADWARGRGAVALVLGVHEDNARARSAYARLGFVETGVGQPYANDPTRRELEMVRPLR